MSKYTTQLRWIVEQVQGKVPYSASQRYTPETWEKIGLADYDLWEPDYRATLNAKIIDHYYFKEIGFETVAQFAWYIRMTMQEIMPYYNKLYETQAMMTEPLRDWYRHGTRDNQNIVSGSIENEMLYGGSDRSAYGGTDTLTDTKTGTETEVFDGCEEHNGSDVVTTDRETTDHTRTVYQDTPMSLLDNVTAPTIEGLDYATNVTYVDGSGTEDATVTTQYGHGIDRDDTTTTTFNTVTEHETEYGKTVTDTYGKTVNTNETSSKTDEGGSQWDEYGLNSSQAKLLEEWKKAWTNIDVEIIKHLDKCFMGLW